VIRSHLQPLEGNYVDLPGLPLVPGSDANSAFHTLEHAVAGDLAVLVAT
jgi:hypothetical protein